MQQNIYSILLFSLISLGLFYIVSQKIKVYILLFASIIFYAICDIKFLLLILFETLLSWFIGNRIIKTENDGTKYKSKKMLFLGIFIILLFLCIFKYFNFFVDCFHLSFSHILLPLGISYFSFKTISYLADIYLQKRESEKSIINYAVYVMFFPHLICGPIVRSSSMTEKMNEGLCYNDS